jgi:hypothetical protein
MAGPEPEGYLSLFDPFGDRLLWILKSRAGALLQLSVVVNEPAGLKEAVLAEVNRKLLRSLRSDLEQRHGLRLVEVDWRYCDWIAADGYERAKARGELREAASSYPQLRLQLFPRPAEPQRSPIESAPEITADEVSLRSSAELFAEKELQFWFLPEEVLSPYLKRYNEMRESPIVLDRFQQASRVNEIVQSALEEVFSGEGASSWRRRLEETAWFFRKTGRAEAARRARAAAEALSQSSSGGRQIPFFEELVRRSFGLFFEREAEKEREEKASSLIVTPDEIRQQRAEAARSGSRLRPK